MIKHFKETLGEHAKRVKEHGRNPPLRTFKELCEELGVPQRTMMGKLKLEGAPKPAMRQATSRGNASWYEPKAFKAWWAKQNPDPLRPELRVPTRHCDECKHMFFDPNGDANQYVCRIGHRPRWYKQKSPVDDDYGFKRKCEDFSQEF